MKNSSSRIDAPKKKSSCSSTTSTGKKSSVIYKSIYLNIENLIDKYNRKSRDVKDLKPRSRDVSRDSSHARHSKNSVCLSRPGASIQIDNFLKDQPQPQHLLTKQSFNYHYIIGKGGFGKVWKVENKKSRQFYAMKEMLKSLVMAKKSIESVINEKCLLERVQSPFIVNMHYAFQDREVLYLVMDWMQGGDLRYHIGSRTRFTEIQAKFFIACIIIGLEYLHTQHIIHRDIKPQNLVFDSKGYIRITDLGIARLHRPENSSDTSGTPGYMSPEVICRQDHSYVSDYFAVGVIAYELMFGKRPYPGRSRKEIRDQILSKQVEIRRAQIPEHWSLESADFINRLIQRKPENRLGYKGIQQLKDHPWVRELNWSRLEQKQIQSPFVPSMRKDNFDQDEQITIDDQQQANLIQKKTLLLRKTEYQDIFKGYYYDGTVTSKQQQGTEPGKKVLTTAECSEDEFRRQETLKPGDRSVTCASIFDTGTVPKELSRSTKIESLQTAIKLIGAPSLSKSKYEKKQYFFPSRR